MAAYQQSVDSIDIQCPPPPHTHTHTHTSHTPHTPHTPHTHTHTPHTSHTTHTHRPGVSLRWLQGHYLLHHYTGRSLLHISNCKSYLLTYLTQQCINYVLVLYKYNYSTFSQDSNHLLTGCLPPGLAALMCQSDSSIQCCHNNHCNQVAAGNQRFLRSEGKEKIKVTMNIIKSYNLLRLYSCGML